MALRVGIVGATRRRQGIGQHIARHLAALGADVTAIAGSRRETAEQTAAGLAAQHALRVRPYGSLREMLASEPLDAVAICSPQEFHREHLTEALAAGVHVLCEKPLVFEEDRDGVADARPIVEGFAAARRVLMVNEQWPYTLEAFERLYPEARLRRELPRKFAMLLSPDALGPEMIPNSLPHALSLLAALTPREYGTHEVRAREIGVEFGEIDGVPGAAAEVRFSYDHAQGATRVALTMQRTAEQPRPAGYQIDGRWAFRRIEMPEYRMWLEHRHVGLTARSSPAARSPAVPLDDPLVLLLADFLKRCERPSTSADVYTDGTILDRLAILRNVYRAACGQLEGAR